MRLSKPASEAKPICGTILSKNKVDAALVKEVTGGSSLICILLSVTVVVPVDPSTGTKRIFTSSPDKPVSTGCIPAPTIVRTFPVTRLLNVNPLPSIRVPFADAPSGFMTFGSKVNSIRNDTIPG